MIGFPVVHGLHSTTGFLGHRMVRIRYSGHPIVIIAGDSRFHIIKTEDPGFRTPYLLTQPVNFNAKKPTEGYKGLWEGTPVRIGRECSDAARFILNRSVSREHFEIVRYGDTFIIKDLNSTLGTRVIDDEEAQNKDIEAAALKNKEKVLSPDFRHVLERESVGGNAGSHHAAVNGIIDANGNIVSFGNEEFSKPEIAKGVKEGSLFDFSFLVNVNKNDEPAFQWFVHKAYSAPEPVIQALVLTTTLLNQTENPYYC